MTQEHTDLRSVDEEEIYGELRRRRVPQYKLVEALNISWPRAMQDPAWSLRRMALFFLAALSFVLIIVIGYLSIMGMEIPDLLSGLAGSGIGAIAGILASGGGTGPAKSDQATNGSPATD